MKNALKESWISIRFSEVWSNTNDGQWKQELEKYLGKEFERSLYRTMYSRIRKVLQNTYRLHL